MQVTDEMVRVALSAYGMSEAEVTGEDRDYMRAALTAALAAMWRPIEEAPDNRPAMYGYLTQFGEWYQYRFEHPTIPRHCGYTHYAEMLPSPPKAEG